jgi:hypothetical protein
MVEVCLQQINEYESAAFCTESGALMKLQEQTGFVNTVLADSTEDVLNDI